MDLKENQSALILEADEHGGITVEVASGDHECLTAAICGAIAKKVLTDKVFQEEIMDMVEELDE